MKLVNTMLLNRVVGTGRNFFSTREEGKKTNRPCIIEFNGVLGSYLGSKGGRAGDQGKWKPVG